MKEGEVNDARVSTRLTEIFPKVPPVKRLLVCQPRLDSIDAAIWLRSFQGLINRDEPHFYRR